MIAKAFLNNGGGFIVKGTVAIEKSRLEKNMVQQKGESRDRTRLNEHHVRLDSHSNVD